MWTTTYPRKGWVRWSWSVANTSLRPDLPLELAEIPGVTVRDVSPTTGFVEAHRLALAAIACLWSAPSAEMPALLAIGDREVVDRVNTLRPLFAHQQGAVDFALGTLSGCIIADEMGLGKQQPVDSMVLTPRGYRRIGNLAVGDFVIGSNGQPTEVLGVFPQGVRPSYRVHFHDGSSVEAGPDHLWAVRYLRGGRTWSTLVVTTEQLRIGATLPPVTHANGVTKQLCLANAELYLPMLSAPAVYEARSTPLPIPAYTLGLLIANGSLAQRSVALTVNTVDWPEVRYALVAEGTALGAVHAYGSATRVGLPGLVRKIADLGLDVLSAEKAVPSAYLHALPEERIALLQGLMDGDGSCSVEGNRVTYSTISAQLAADVCRLVEELGGIASSRAYDRRAENKGVEFSVRVRLPPQIAVFRVTRKASRHTRGTARVPVRGFSHATFVRNVESVCIRVAAADALYATEHAILTHNTTAAAVAAIARVRGLCGRHEVPAPVMIVGPKFTRDVWRRELWALDALRSDADFVALGGVGANDDSFARAPFWFCHGDILAAWTPRIWFNHSARRPGVLIVDEAHHFKNPATSRAKAVLRVAGVTPFKLVLTGTPMPNTPRDLYMLLAIVSGEHAWGKVFNFRRRYCGAVQGEHGMQDLGPTHTPELHARLKDCYISRTKAEVGLNLPPLTRNVVRVEPPTDMRRLQALTLADSGCTMAQLVDAIRAGRGGTRVFEVLHALRRMTSAAKISTTTALVESCLEQGQSVLVFAHERKTAESIATRALDGVHLHGGLNQDVRDQIVADFQATARTRPQCLAATYGALREGVTLTAASHVILHDLDWTPANIWQAEARPHRPGTTGVQVHWLVLRDSIDTLLAEALVRKALESATVLDDTSARAMRAALDSLELERTAGVRTVQDEVAQLFNAWG